MSWQSCLLKHVRGVGAPEPSPGWLAGVSENGREQERTGLGAKAGRLEVFVEKLLELVMDGKLFLFAALLSEAEQPERPRKTPQPRCDFVAWLW